VSSVGVLPTHRRRGVLRTMMEAGLADARDRGCALSILIASEGEIYERYGFGVATEHCMWTLDKRMIRWREDYMAGFDFDLCFDADLKDVAPAVYEQARLGMPGAMERDELTWQQYLGMSGLSHENPSKARPAVVVRRDGQPVGYARYNVKESSEQRVDTSVLELHDLCCVTPEASAATWQFVASLDLVSKIEAGDRPPHEPLPWLLHDRRAARQSILADFQWLAVLDVLAALRGRSYDVPGRCVLEVADHGVFALESDGKEAAVEKTTARADLTLPAHALGSAYLGQVPVSTLHAAGLVEEHTDGAVATLGALLAHQPTAAIGYTWF
jgi:predicted acetyltransferase